MVLPCPGRFCATSAVIDGGFFDIGLQFESRFTVKDDVHQQHHVGYCDISVTVDISVPNDEIVIGMAKI